ncbi:MAG: tetratricopeptide repeat protein [Deltaproteobacteria bacterium]|nr:tetratricopeptide repeat protein [Deltaproteobacteria bacterium]
MKQVRSQKSAVKIHWPKKLLPVAYCLSPLFFLFTACSQDPAMPAYEKAEELFSQRAYTKAINSYSNIVNKYPESPYASASQYKIGLINHLYMADIRRAMNAYATLMLLYPDSKEVALARSDLADIYIHKGDYRKALGEYQWLVKNTGGDRRDNFQYQIAMAYLKLTDIKQARIELQEAYLKLTDIKQARIELQEVIKSSLNSPLGPQVYYQIANTYYLEGDYKAAIKSYERVISSYPKNPYADEARLGKAVCIEETGNLAEAVELYKELEKSYPNPDVIKIRLDAIEAREKKNTPVARKGD